MSGAIVLSPKGLLTSEALKVELEQRKLLAQYVRECMVPATDYGKIPGTGDRLVLLKPGAEKLVDLFRCTPKYTLIRIEEDFGRGFFNYIFRVRLFQRTAEAVLAEGYGSANSMEGRYRWREAQRKCPKCDKPTIFASKLEPGFYCWAKKGGCGAKFGPTDQTILGQQAGRIENEDIASQANTILKMAKKRALVDGAIALARCSDMFTQDVEDDLPTEERPPQGEPKDSAPRAQQAATPKPSRVEETKAAVRAAAQQSAYRPARMAVVDVKDGEDEEQATKRTKAEQRSRELPVRERLLILCKEDGLTDFLAASFVCSATGKDSRAELAEADVAKVVAALSARRAAREREAAP